MLHAEQILALAPDAAAAKAAKGLAAPARWANLGQSDEAVWGACKGSGAKPYEVVIDRSGPAFRCTCPSRKFPCKHGLALGRVLAQQPDAVGTSAPPDRVTEWLASRRERAEKQAEKRAALADQDAPPAAAPEAAAQREAKRLARMIAGARDLERWMGDLVRHGLSDLPSKPASFWRNAAARLVDAQAPGLAGVVHQVESAASSGEGFHQRALLLLGRAHLLLAALQRIESLPADLACDVRTAAGWPTDSEAVLRAGAFVADDWLVLGVSYDENDNLWERRAWLRGSASGRTALLLEFSHGGRHFEAALVPGTTRTGPLAFYPSAAPLRALRVGTLATSSGTGSRGGPSATWDEALEPVAEAIAANPWAQRLPVQLDIAIPVRRGRSWSVRDARGGEAPLAVAEADGWELSALSGGHPLALFGEWLGDRLRPLSAWQGPSITPRWTEKVRTA